MIATAIVIAIIFSVIYFIVHTTVYQNLDRDLSYEAHKHTRLVYYHNDSIKFNNKAEWLEREHREVQVNPVFIQILDTEGRLMDKSPNLKEERLPFERRKSHGNHFNTSLSKKAIRQVQLPIDHRGEVKGYMLAAMSLEPSRTVLRNLRQTLLLLYPLVLMGLFFVTRSLAGRSIRPVLGIIDTTKRITQHNLNARIEAPPIKDELYTLSTSINELLQRIQNAMEREKQFTSDASHELRTPLSVLRGTLEVLIRKPRTETEYRKKIQYCLTEIDRMTHITEQLLLLARFEKSAVEPNVAEIQLARLIEEILSRYVSIIQEKSLQIEIDDKSFATIATDPYYADLILDNILSNALKYSHPSSTLFIYLETQEGKAVCKIKDQGIGIKQEHLANVLTPFFRSDALNHKHIQGIGLGLSIVKKACEAIKARLILESEHGVGTTARIEF